MTNYFRKGAIGYAMGLLSCVAMAGAVDDLNCQINSLTGGNCLEIRKINEAITRINQYSEEQDTAWMAGNITATQMVRNVIDFHKSLLQLNGYDRERYSYNLQVAEASDSGKISKDRASYLMEHKSNEINERVQARQPPANRPFTCKSQSFGGVITTKCE